MTEEEIKFWVACWGAGLSTILGCIKLWEVFWKGRLRLAFTQSFNSLDEK